MTMVSIIAYLVATACLGVVVGTALKERASHRDETPALRELRNRIRHYRGTK